MAPPVELRGRGPGREKTRREPQKREGGIRKKGHRVDTLWAAAEVGGAPTERPLGGKPAVLESRPHQPRPKTLSRVVRIEMQDFEYQGKIPTNSWKCSKMQLCFTRGSRTAAAGFFSVIVCHCSLAQPQVVSLPPRGGGRRCSRRRGELSVCVFPAAASHTHHVILPANCSLLFPVSPSSCFLPLSVQHPTPPFSHSLYISAHAH